MYRTGYLSPGHHGEPLALQEEETNQRQDDDGPFKPVLRLAEVVLPKLIK